MPNRIPTAQSGTVEGASNRGGGAPSARGWAESQYDTSETDIPEDEVLDIDEEWDSDEGGYEGEGPDEEAKGGEEEGPSPRCAPAEVPAPESAPPTTARRRRVEEGPGLAGATQPITPNP
jgi:hypothetical protein